MHKLFFAAIAVALISGCAANPSRPVIDPQDGAEQRVQASNKLVMDSVEIAAMLLLF